MPLKGIPTVISAELLHSLALLGHGDVIIIADAHFPAASISARSLMKPILVNADGIKIPELLEGILKLINLDTYVTNPVSVMDLEEADIGKVDVTIWKRYEEIIPNIKIEKLRRKLFYEQAEKAFLIIKTGETAQYANIKIVNGIVTEKTHSSTLVASAIATSVANIATKQKLGKAVSIDTAGILTGGDEAEAEIEDTKGDEGVQEPKNGAGRPPKRLARKK